jgi:putative transposase
MRWESHVGFGGQSGETHQLKGWQGVPVRPYTKLRGAQRDVYYELYVIIDIYSRFVVGWTVAAGETGELAKQLIADTYNQHGVTPGQLALHADRGTSTTSKPVAQLLVDLGVERSHSRPQVSNDNPYS